MRTFIAIELDKQIKEELSKLQEELKKSQSDVKWVEPKNIHLTLKFLGEVEEKKIERVKNLLEEISKNNGSFNMTLQGLGAFPKLNYPRVIWIGVQQGQENISKVATELEDKLSKIGFAKEKRPFSGHITIGRVRSPKNRAELINIINQLNNNQKLPPLTQPINHITLFKSTLTPKGPIYETLYIANLINNCFYKGQSQMSTDSPR